MSQHTRAHTTAAARKPTKPAKAVTPEETAETATPAAASAPRRGGRKSASAAPQPATAPIAETALDAIDTFEPLTPDALARLLRAIATELERDPALARRLATAMNEPPVRESAPARATTYDAEPTVTIGRAFHPTIVTGVTPDLGKGIPDPFELRDRLGVDGLREALESLRLGSLRAIIREHHLDPSGRLAAQNDAAKLRERIVKAAMKGA